MFIFCASHSGKELKDRNLSKPKRRKEAFLWLVLTMSLFVVELKIAPGSDNVPKSKMNWKIFFSLCCIFNKVYNASPNTIHKARNKIGEAWKWEINSNVIDVWFIFIRAMRSIVPFSLYSKPSKRCTANTKIPQCFEVPSFQTFLSDKIMADGVKSIHFEMKIFSTFHLQRARCIVDEIWKSQRLHFN